jgi:hypothetical protein
LSCTSWGSGVISCGAPMTEMAGLSRSCAFLPRTNGQKNRVPKGHLSAVLSAPADSRGHFRGHQKPNKNGHFFDHGQVADIFPDTPGTCADINPQPYKGWGLSASLSVRRMAGRESPRPPSARAPLSGVAACAISQFPMPHQRRNQSAPLLSVRLREKGNGASAAVTLSLTAHRWPNGAGSRFENNGSLVIDDACVRSE